MKNIFILIIGLIISIITSITAFSQEWMPVILNERGDTVYYDYPPPR